MTAMMDLDDLQAEMDEACRLDDEMREKHAHWEWRQRKRQQEEARSQMVYKTFDATESATRDDGWNEWFAASFQNHFDHHIAQNNEMLIDVIGEETHEMVKAIIKLREQIAALRTELEVVRSIVRGEVASIKGAKSDVA